MKDARGHGSDPRGAHSQGVQAVGGTPVAMRSMSSMHPYYHADLTPQDKAVVEGMRQTIRSGGTLPPMTILPDGRVNDGNHRWYAYKAEGVKEAPVYVGPRTYDEIKEDDKQKAAFYGGKK